MATMLTLIEFTDNLDPFAENCYITCLSPPVTTVLFGDLTMGVPIFLV